MRGRTASALAAALAVTACTGGPPSRQPDPDAAVRTATLPTIPPPPEVYPGTTWQRADAVGADFSELDRTLQRTGSTCVAVVKGGRLVHDASWAGTDARTPRKVYSITKSLTSILVGMAADAGALDLEDSASEWVDEWRTGPAAEISVRDLLSMTSGRRYDDATDSRMIRSETDKTAFAVGLEQDRAPGERWVYDNASVQVLESVLDDVSDTDDVASVAQERLLDPLGMQDTTWPRDAAGNATTYSGVESTCQDLARVGVLMLRHGTWRDRQLLSRSYVEEATGRPSSEHNAAYGLLWWHNHEGRIVEVLRQAGYPQDRPPYEGRLAPDVPGDAFWAYGYGDEYVAVVPSRDVVAVRLGARPATPDALSFNGFTRGVLGALDPR